MEPPRNGVSPRILKACTAYRRRFGSWPTTVTIWQGMQPQFDADLDDEHRRKVEERVTIDWSEEPTVIAAGIAGHLRYEDAEDDDDETSAAQAWLGVRAT